MKYNVSVIGFGMSAREFHIPAIVKNENLVLKQVMTRSEKNQSDLKKLYPGVTLITSFEEALNDKDIDVIVIATPNDVHFEYTKNALLNGKHVCVEKPFVETYKEAKELFDLASKKGLLLKVFHNRRYDGDLLTLKNLIQKEDFGKLISFEARFDRLLPNISENWRFKKEDMAGIYYDLAPHLVHHAVDLFGFPNSIYNNIFFDRTGAIVDDHFEMTLYYTNNFTVRLGAEMLLREKKPKLKLVGENLTYVKYSFDYPDSVNEEVTSIYQEKNPISTLISNSNSKEINVLKGTHYIFYKKFVDDIGIDVYDIDDTKFALSVVLLMEKGLESHDKQKQVHLK